jgi:hypothetical protein
VLFAVYIERQMDLILHKNNPNQNCSLLYEGYPDQGGFGDSFCRGDVSKFVGVLERLWTLPCKTGFDLFSVP